MAAGYLPPSMTPYEAQRVEVRSPAAASWAWGDAHSRLAAHKLWKASREAALQAGRPSNLGHFAHDDTSIGTGTGSVQKRFLSFRRRNKSEAAQPTHVLLKSWFSPSPSPSIQTVCIQTPTSSYDASTPVASCILTPPQASDDELDWSESEEVFCSPRHTSPDTPHAVPDIAVPHSVISINSMPLEQSNWESSMAAWPTSTAQCGLGIFNADLPDLVTATQIARRSSVCDQDGVTTLNQAMSASSSRREAVVQCAPDWLRLIDDCDDDEEVFFLPKTHPERRASLSSMHPSPSGRRRPFRPSSRRTQSSASTATDDSFEGPTYPNPRIDRPFWIPPSSSGSLKPKHNGKRASSSASKIRSPVIFEEVDLSDLEIFGVRKLDPSLREGSSQSSQRSTCCPSRVSVPDEMSTSAGYAAKAYRDQRKSYDSFCSWSYLEAYMSSSASSTPSLHHGSTTEEDSESLSSSPGCGFDFMLRPSLSSDSNDVFANNGSPYAEAGEEEKCRIPRHQALVDSGFTLDKHAAFMAQRLRHCSSPTHASINQREGGSHARFSERPATPERSPSQFDKTDADKGLTLHPSTPVLNETHRWDEEYRIDIVAVEPGESGWPQLKWSTQATSGQSTPSVLERLPGSPPSADLDSWRFQRGIEEPSVFDGRRPSATALNTAKPSSTPVRLTSAFSSPDSLGSLPRLTPSFRPRPLLLRSNGHSARDAALAFPRPPARSGSSQYSVCSDASTPSTVRALNRPLGRPLQLPSLHSTSFSARATLRIHPPVPASQLTVRSQTNRRTYSSSPLSIWPASAATERRPSPFAGTYTRGDKASQRHGLSYNPRQAADVFGGPLYPTTHTPGRRTTTHTSTIPPHFSPPGAANTRSGSERPALLAPPPNLGTQGTPQSSAEGNEETLRVHDVVHVGYHAGTTLKHITGSAL